MTLEYALETLNTLEHQYHKLRNTWPCGMRVVDDRTDREREATLCKLEEARRLVMRLRAERKTHESRALP